MGEKVRLPHIKPSSKYMIITKDTPKTAPLISPFPLLIAVIAPTKIETAFINWLTVLIAPFDRFETLKISANNKMLDSAIITDAIVAFVISIKNPPFIFSLLKKINPRTYSL